jgi:high-affinity iron transporter
MFAPVYLIGLREGLEASLVVSILIAYLVRTSRRDKLWPIWCGVGVAIALSLGVGALLTYTSAHLSFQAQEAFGGIMSIIAVCFVTWMIFWMRRAARSMRGELEQQVDRALAMGTGALVVTAFLAVGREGVETALFVWSTVAYSDTGIVPFVGLVLGLGTAVVLAYLLYRRALKINLGTFFTWTGAGLVVVAGGVLAYGVHDLQEAGLLPGLNNLAFDVSNVIAPTSFLGTLLKGIFNFSPATTWLQAVAWTLYVVPVMFFFLRGSRRAPEKPASPNGGQAVPASVR